MIIFAFISKGRILLNKRLSPPFVCSFFSANAEPATFCYCRYSASGLTREDASKAFQIGASLQQSEFIVTSLLQHDRSIFPPSNIIVYLLREFSKRNRQKFGSLNLNCLREDNKFLSSSITIY